MASLAICLWFDGRAQEAARFYIDTFRACGRAAGFVDRLGGNDGGPNPEGSTMTVTFALDGTEFVGLNGGPVFPFTPAVSMFVRCADQTEVDSFWERLLDGGHPSQCGWLSDKFGLSWQIVPNALGTMLQAPDRVGAARAMKAMMTMTKLDIAALKRAFDGP